MSYHFTPAKMAIGDEMATHCSVLAWEIPRIEEPGGLQSMGLQTVRHNLATKQELKPKKE